MQKYTVNNIRDLYNKYNDNEYIRTQPFMWHYTNINGLMGIVRNEESERGKLHFWFTQSDFLNDTSEGNHILDLYRTVCEELKNRKKITKYFYNAIKEVKISNDEFITYPVWSEKYGNHTAIDCKPCTAFICSFSLSEDSLDMWRYYSKSGGGYGIKLSSLIFYDKCEYSYSRMENKDIEFSFIKSFKVIYDDNEKKKMLGDMILDTFTVYKNESKSEKIIERVRQFLEYLLKKIQFQFKHSCYSSENEYRFVFYRPNTKPQNMKNKLPDICYRAQNGVIIPYLDVVIEEFALINEVMISPYLKETKALESTKAYLSECGFGSAMATRSHLPVRF